MEAANPKDRVLGVFLGCAVGDALGAPLEGQPLPPGFDQEELLKGFRSMPGWPAGQYTDDTMLTLALARSLAERGGAAGGYIIEEFAELWRKGTIVGAGKATNSAIAAFLYRQVPWDECAAPVGSAGNGAAMRAAPVGIWYFDDLDALVDASVEAARVSHRDPRSVAVAVAVSLMTALAFNSTRLKPGPTLIEIAERVLKIDTGVSDHLFRLFEWFKKPEEDAVERIVATGQFGHWRGTWNGRITAYAVPTVLIAFYSFLRYQDDFSSAVSRAVLTGGDVDTTGAITGALSGALLGADAIPLHLREGVLDSKEIAAAAADFYQARFEAD
jgi:ADP-ribosylglycohydrolase